jgi:hypothetical protein
VCVGPASGSRGITDSHAIPIASVPNGIPSIPYGWVVVHLWTPPGGLSGSVSNESMVSWMWDSVAISFLGNSTT